MTKSDFAKHPTNSKKFRFTKRDGEILEAIHRFDGMLSPSQVARLFFNPNTGLRQAQHRLHLLWGGGYLKRPDRFKRMEIGAAVYFLDKKGASYVAGLRGEILSGFKWRTKPRWSLVKHDLAVNDFIIDMMWSCGEHPYFELKEWIPSGEFWANPDEVKYTDHNGKRAKRRVRPDIYFLISFSGADGKRGNFRFLVEIDNGSEDNLRIGREKVLPGIAYIDSDAYEKRFGHKTGAFLFVTTSKRRVDNMMRRTEAVAGKRAGIFYFTWFDQVTPETVLTAPIWFRGSGGESGSLVEMMMESISLHS
jgi:hypothetical protein